MSIESMILSHHLAFCLQSFPAWMSFPKSHHFASSGQSVGASALASVLSMNIQGWFLLKLTGLLSFQSKGLSRVFFSTTVRKHQFFGAQPSLWSNSHIRTFQILVLFLHCPLRHELAFKTLFIIFLTLILKASRLFIHHSYSLTQNFTSPNCFLSFNIRIT